MPGIHVFFASPKTDVDGLVIPRAIILHQNERILDSTLECGPS